MLIADNERTYFVDINFTAFTVWSSTHCLRHAAKVANQYCSVVYSDIKRGGHCTVYSAAAFLRVTKSLVFATDIWPTPRVGKRLDGLTTSKRSSLINNLLTIL